VPPTQPPVDPSLRRSAVAVATLGGFLMPFMSSSVNIALPAIGRDFPAAAATLGWVPTAALLSAAALVVPLGRLADLRGRRRVFLAGVVVFTLASLAAALARSVGQLIAARAVQGMGAAAVFGTGVAILTSVLPPGERGRALGLNTAAVYFGLSIGPFAGGWLTSVFGWRSVFAAIVPVGGLMIVLLLVWLKGEWVGGRGERYDLPGALLFVVLQVALLLGLTRLMSPSGGLLVAVGLAALTAFVWWEARTAHPVLEMALLRRNTVFAMSSLAALVNYAATAAVGFLLSLYLQYVRGLSPSAAGLVLIAQPVMMMLVSPFAGSLSDRVEPRYVASLGMGLSALGLGALAFIGLETPVALVAACLLVLGTGFGLFTSPNTNAIMGAVEPRHYGVAAGFAGAMRLTGQVFSMGIAMLIFAAYLGATPVKGAPPHLLVAGTRTALALFAALCAVGVLPSLARGRVR
jgi:EmrB/QacA subfamily drug resistance transporter